jgi:hypothetical protein
MKQLTLDTCSEEMPRSEQMHVGNLSVADTGLTDTQEVPQSQL